MEYSLISSLFALLSVCITSIHVYAMGPNTQIIKAADETAVINELIKIVEKYASSSIEKKGLFKIGLSGGSLVRFLSKGLPSIKNTDWEKWRFFFCDERVVPFDSDDSTFGQYKKNLIGKIPINEYQFITIDPKLSAEQAAINYIKKMVAYFSAKSWPNFDMLLLGMGPDGHTCSLFPGHHLLEERTVWVAPIKDSPKPPPSRITFTFPVLNNASVCLFVSTGKDKAPVLKRILKDGEPLPAGRITSNTIWIVDKEAGELI